MGYIEEHVAEDISLSELAQLRGSLFETRSLLRGMALLMILVDHIPGNVLSLVTLHNFGASDDRRGICAACRDVINAGLW